MAILYGFAARCLFCVGFLHYAKQGRLLCAVSNRVSWRIGALFFHAKEICDLSHKTAKICYELSPGGKEKETTSLQSREL